MNKTTSTLLALAGALMLAGCGSQNTPAEKAAAHKAGQAGCGAQGKASEAGCGAQSKAVEGKCGEGKCGSK